MKAWIIKWAWIGDHAIVEDPVIGILSARLSPKEVLKYVERCYASQHYSISEQITHARYNKPSPPPYPAQYDSIEGVAYSGYISCGHNPFIEAFVADGIGTDENTGSLVWDQKSVELARDRFRRAINSAIARRS